MKWCLAIALVAAAVGMPFAFVQARDYSRANAEGDHIATQLSPAIPESARANVARGVFYRKVVTLTVGDGPVLLASTPDGLGRLRVDDVARLTVEWPDGARRAWQFDFRTSDRNNSGAIRDTPPQDITAIFSRGIHTVTLVLSDVWPPVFSSTAFFLVHPVPRAASVDAENDVLSPPPTTPSAPMPTSDPAAVKDSPADVAIRTTATTLHVTPTTRSTVAYVTSATKPVLTASPASDLNSPAAQQVAPSIPVPVVIAGMFLLVLATSGVVVAAVRLRAAQAQAGLIGLVNLHDATTGEHLDNVDLTSYGTSAVVAINPLRLVRAASAPTELAVLATLRHGPDGLVCERAEIPSNAGTPNNALGDKDEITLGDRVTLEYRSPA